MILKEFNLQDLNRPEGIVMRSKVDCLRICKNGPILLIWPDGIWYEGVTPERIEKIVLEHILNGKVLNNWILKRTTLEQTRSYV